MNGSRLSLSLAIGLIMAAVFTLDLLLPLGVAAGVPYVIAVLVSVWAPEWKVTVATAVIATALTILGYFASEPAGIQWMVLVNRGLAIGVIWISAYLLIQRKRTTKELMLSSHRLAAVFDTVPDGLVVIDDSGTIETFNQAAERLFGYSAEEMIGKNVALLMPRPESKEHDEYLARYFASGEKRIIGQGREVMAKKKDGTRFPVRLAVGEMNLHGHHAFTGILHDLTELRDVEKKSLEDSTTGLPNRRAFDDLLSAALSRDQVSLLFVDLDKLKSINDELGHLRGDEAIATAAEKIASSLRTTDPGACARIGGDEFGVVLPHIGEKTAKRIAQRILAAAQPAMQAIHPDAGVSIGIANAAKNTPREEILRSADEALYRAKEKRGCVSL
ncbi:MAG: diguanylate cyclase [Gammaproteobacteria bacterium]|nr:diguanylate cyclase [Gammaproteobacteria bacterium]NNF60373.1 diguanylate cyclase [Gammaproteobacteria bacterium]